MASHAERFFARLYGGCTFIVPFLTRTDQSNLHFVSRALRRVAEKMLVTVVPWSCDQAFAAFHLHPDSTTTFTDEATSDDHEIAKLRPAPPTPTT